ncbi:MAG: two-component system, OmpR family, sensor histidine kinase PrrB, partial [Mycobacterium sp.]|nr:two-component system, OmpR family, sensor histidine kinase PrrB [Mycobacterium sp.]
MRFPRFGRSASLRTRVAVASALAASAVVAAFTVLTSVVLLNNDAAQLDRRLDSIVEASMYPDESGPHRGVLTTGRSRSTGQVVFQRGFQLPKLGPGTSTVLVNGVEYRVRTIPLEQQGGAVLISVGIPTEGALLNRARIPLYTAVGVFTVL